MQEEQLAMQVEQSAEKPHMDLEMARRALEALRDKGSALLMPPEDRIALMDKQAELRKLREKYHQQPQSDELDEHPDLQRAFTAACKEFYITHHDFAKPGVLSEALRMQLYTYAQL